MKKSTFFAIPVTLIIFSLLLRLPPIQQLSPSPSIDPTDLQSKYNPNETKAIFNNQPLTVPAASDPDLTNILGKTSKQKRIEIDLTRQVLYAYEGDNLIYKFLISSGLWGRTPIGRYRIWTKLRYAKMEGGSRALHTYYYLPNVPYIMYFYSSEIPKSRGFGIHGTYWHNNFGHPMSHGCINMRTEEVAILFYWANPDLKGQRSIYATSDNLGTPVIIYGKAPNY